jgi:hypothetical protein
MKNHNSVYLKMIEEGEEERMKRKNGGDFRKEYAKETENSTPFSVLLKLGTCLGLTLV